jgi:putative membrane protein
MKKHLKYAFLSSLLIMGGISCAQAAASSATQDFVTKAAVANQFEIASSRLALQDSHNTDVKAFAQQMIDDHKIIGDNMVTTLATPGMDVQAPGNNLDAKHQAMLDQLTKSSTADFDRKYVGMQVDGHQEAAALFGTYANGGDNAALKAFAVQTLPVIQGHLEHADKLKAAF